MVTRIALMLALLFAADAAQAARVHVAVAANFTAPAKEIAAAFEAATGDQAVLSFGSTGKLFTQISHGAPFRVFLAADTARPQRAVADGLAVAGSQFTYAQGQLVLYSADPDMIDGTPAVLSTNRFRKIAIANPKTAPYGTAAQSVLKRMGLFQTIKSKIVTGENSAQTYQFVATGNAQLGFVAGAQILQAPGSRWPVPGDLHDPIDQDAVLLRAGADDPVARAFLAFLQSDPARRIIRRYGYRGDGG